MSDLKQTAGSVGCELAAEVIRRFGVVRLRVTGCSMLPLVAAGDVLVVHRRTAADFAAGEIALFTRHQRLFAHRVVGKICRGGDCVLLTRGDTLPENDSPVTSDELLGQVEAIERGSQRLYPHAPAGWSLLLGRMGRGSSDALRAMAQWRGLRPRAQPRIARLLAWLADTPQGDGLVEEYST